MQKLSRSLDLAKIKLTTYLVPYFTAEAPYSVAQSNEVEYVKGHSSLILRNKLRFMSGIPVGMFSSPDENEGLQYRDVHISGLCESILGMLELGRREEALTMYDFLLSGLEEFEFDKFSYAIWKTYSTLNPTKFYVHGMGQGEILTALVRGRNLGILDSSCDKWLILVANSFLVDFDHPHGFVERNSGNYAWIHEYPKAGMLTFEADNVLNGFCFAIIGLGDFNKYLGKDEELGSLLSDCIQTLEVVIDKYDKGYWSAYALHRNKNIISSYHYHQLHIVLLRVIGERYKSEVLLRFSNLFYNYAQSPKLRLLSLFLKVLQNLMQKGNLYRVR